MTPNLEKLKDKFSDLLYFFNNRFIIRISKLFADFALEQEKRSDQEFYQQRFLFLRRHPHPLT